MENVILVDEQNNEIGIEEKLKAHLSGKLHRAVSVFLFNEDREMLIQQRAFEKYHSGGLWSNTCCSHPRPGEVVLQAAKRRLFEEMGIHCELEEIFQFIYKSALDHQLTEYEFDHVFVGQYAGIPKPNPLEACAYRWISIPELKYDISSHPEKYTFWFKKILQEHLNKFY